VNYCLFHYLHTFVINYVHEKLDSLCLYKILHAKDLKLYMQKNDFDKDLINFKEIKIEIVKMEIFKIGFYEPFISPSTVKRLSKNS
jgi:hypothetical protein